MGELVATQSAPGTDLESAADYKTEQFVSVIVAGQLFGLPVLAVHDILGPQQITKVPLAPPEVAGSLNLRGKIVTAINVRERMALPKYEHYEESMHVVVELGEDQYSLIVDRVGEVLNFKPGDYEKNPPTLDPRWKDMSAGIFRLPEDLMVVLDVDQLIRTPEETEE